jgi:hypothetical protein
MGPVGPQGLIGPTGPKGDVGGIDPVSSHAVMAQEQRTSPQLIQENSNGNIVAVANCPAGESLLSGGCAYSETNVTGGANKSYSLMSFGPIDHGNGDVAYQCSYSVAGYANAYGPLDTYIVSTTILCLKAGSPTDTQ